MEKEKFNLFWQNIYQTKAHNICINQISIFPSGNLISVSIDKSIKIYDNKFDLLQHIQNANDD